MLLNRKNVVVDILSEVRYIKLQSLSGLVIGCEENEGTGVIGSDCDTHYTLIKSDSQSNPNAVNVVKIEEIPSEVMNTIYKETEVEELSLDEDGNEITVVRTIKEFVPNLYKYENGEFSYVNTLDEAKLLKQEENKRLFAEYLATHPLTWVDGKQYGITQEDQSEISLNLNQYQIAVTANVTAPILEWHAQHEECTPWEAETLIALSMAITEAVYPIYHKMQQYKTDIFGATTREDLDNINLVYETA